jgi:hypothetical protein
MKPLDMENRIREYTDFVFPTPGYRSKVFSLTYSHLALAGWLPLALCFKTRFKRLRP